MSFNGSTLIPAVVAAVTAGAAAAETVPLEPTNDIIRLVVILGGVIVGTIARSPNWFDETTGAFKKRVFLVDVSAVGLIAMCAWSAAIFFDLTNAQVGAGTGLATFFGLAPFRDFALTALMDWLARKTGKK